VYGTFFWLNLGQMRGISGHVCASNGYHSKLSYLCAISENAWQLPNRFQANLRALTALFKPKIWECWRSYVEYVFCSRFRFFPLSHPLQKCVQLPQLVSEKARSGRWLSPLGGSCLLTCDKALRRLLSVRSRPARGTISLTVSSQVRGVPGEENREKDAD
jgi:hypothetical protein